MADTVKIPDFERQLSNILKKYSKDTGEKIHAAAKAIAKSAALEVKRDSPVGSREKHYKDSWKSKDVGSRLIPGFVVYSAKPNYRIAHLLEKGHAKRNGGRTNPIVHIAPAEQRAIAKFEKAVAKIYEEG